jgi:hypothetical protein
MAMTERTFLGALPACSLVSRGSSFSDSGTMRVSPCCGYPAGHALAHFDAQAAQRLLLSAGGDGVVELLGVFVEHQQRPQLGFDGALHVFKNGAQNGIQIEARGERARQLVENKQICERDAVFRLVRH